MKEVEQLLREYKVIDELVVEARIDGRFEAADQGERALSVIRRKLWNLGINQKTIDRLVTA